MEDFQFDYKLEFELSLQKDPSSEALWLDYIGTYASFPERAFLYQRALQNCVSSSLSSAFLSEFSNDGLGRSPSDPFWRLGNEHFELAVSRHPGSLELWLGYLRFLRRQRWLSTRPRRVFNAALRALPAAAHAALWSQALPLARALRCDAAAAAVALRAAAAARDAQTERDALALLAARGGRSDAIALLAAKRRLGPSLDAFWEEPGPAPAEAVALWVETVGEGDMSQHHQQHQHQQEEEGKGKGEGEGGEPKQSKAVATKPPAALRRSAALAHGAALCAAGRAAAGDAALAAQCRRAAAAADFAFAFDALSALAAARAEAALAVGNAPAAAAALRRLREVVDAEPLWRNAVALRRDSQRPEKWVERAAVVAAAADHAPPPQAEWPDEEPGTLVVMQLDDDDHDHDGHPESDEEEEEDGFPSRSAEAVFAAARRALSPPAVPLVVALSAFREATARPRRALAAFDAELRGDRARLWPAAARARLWALSVELLLRVGRPQAALHRVRLATSWTPSSSSSSSLSSSSSSSASTAQTARETAQEKEEEAGREDDDEVAKDPALWALRCDLERALARAGAAGAAHEQAARVTGARGVWAHVAWLDEQAAAEAARGQQSKKTRTTMTTTKKKAMDDDGDDFDDDGDEGRDESGGRRHEEAALLALEKGARGARDGADALELWAALLARLHARGAEALPRLRDVGGEALRRCARVFGDGFSSSSSSSLGEGSGGEAGRDGLWEGASKVCLLISRIEEDFGAAPRALDALFLLMRWAPSAQRARLLEATARRARRMGGAAMARDAFERGLPLLSRRQTPAAVRSFAEMEALEGEPARARALYVYAAPLAKDDDYWEAWEALERDVGTVDTVKEMVRVRQNCERMWAKAAVDAEEIEREERERLQGGRSETRAPGRPRGGKRVQDEEIDLDGILGGEDEEEEEGEEKESNDGDEEEEEGEEEEGEEMGALE